MKIDMVQTDQSVLTQKYMKKNWNKLTKQELDKMDSIGKAAAMLFQENGYLETSMDEIAAAARFSKGGVFHYFSSKNEILYFVLNNFVDIDLEGLEQQLKEIEDNFSKIQFFISRHIELYVSNTPEAKTMLHEAHLLPPKYFKLITEKEKKYLQIVKQLISDFLGGNIQKDELTVITFSLFGMCNWIYSWYNVNGSISPQQLSKIICDIFFEGLSKWQRTNKESEQVTSGPLRP